MTDFAIMHLKNLFIGNLQITKKIFYEIVLLEDVIMETFGVQIQKRLRISLRRIWLLHFQFCIRNSISKKLFLEWSNNSTSKLLTKSLI